MNKKKIFKSTVVMTVLLLQINLLWAQMSPVTLHVETAGTLSTLINASQKYNITDLILTGNLDREDIRFIRDMAGSDYQGEKTNGQLVNLNLAGANICSIIWLPSVLQPITEFNCITSGMFANCRLKTIILPWSVTFVDFGAIKGCAELETITIGSNVTSTKIVTGDFFNCSKLTEIHCKNPIPPSRENGIDNHFPSNFRTTCTLYVPKGSKNAYQSSFWGYDYFKDIIEEDEETDYPPIRQNITIKVKSSVGWTNALSTYMWTSPYNGKFYAMNLESDNWYSYTFSDVSAINIIIVNGSYWTGPNYESNNKTVDIVNVNASACYSIGSKTITEQYSVNLTTCPTTEINLINKDNIIVQPFSNGITIEAKEQIPVSVYNLFGQKVYQSVIIGHVEIPLNKGVYVVKVNNESKKLIVK